MIFTLRALKSMFSGVTLLSTADWRSLTVCTFLVCYIHFVWYISLPFRLVWLIFASFS